MTSAPGTRARGPPPRAGWSSRQTPRPPCGSSSCSTATRRGSSSALKPPTRDSLSLATSTISMSCSGMWLPRRTMRTTGAASGGSTTPSRSWPVPSTCRRRTGSDASARSGFGLHPSRAPTLVEDVRRKVGAVGPDDGAGLGVDPQRGEDRGVAADVGEHGTMQVGAEVDRLLHAIGETQTNDVIVEDFYVDDVHRRAPTAVARWYRAPRRGSPSPSTWPVHRRARPPTRLRGERPDGGVN